MKKFIVCLVFVVLFYSSSSQAQTYFQLRTIPDGSIEQFNGDTGRWDVRFCPDGTMQVFIPSWNRWIDDKVSNHIRKPMPNGTVEILDTRTNIKTRLMPDGSFEILKTKTFLGIPYSKWELLYTVEQRKQRQKKSIKRTKQKT